MSERHPGRTNVRSGMTRIQLERWFAMKLLDLFVAFTRSGLLGYGGGPSAIPLIKQEAVDRYHWMTADEFGDVLALSNALPGPINTKLAGYIGYRVGGIAGMLVATLATVLPTVLLMIVLLVFLTSLQDQPWVKGMTRAVVPVIGVMLLTMAWEFLKKAQETLGWLKSIGLTAVSLVLLVFADVHPAILIAVILIYVLVRPVKQQGIANDERE